MLFQNLQSWSYPECSSVSFYLESLNSRGRVNPFGYLLLVLEEEFLWNPMPKNPQKMLFVTELRALHIDLAVRAGSLGFARVFAQKQCGDLHQDSLDIVLCNNLVMDCTDTSPGR